MGWFRMLGESMLSDGESIGDNVVAWAQAGPVSETLEDLLKTFADQAVIAVENTRMFDELRARTEELERSYEVVRQQATKLEEQSAELLKLNQDLEKRVT